MDISFHRPHFCSSYRPTDSILLPITVSSLLLEGIEWSWTDDCGQKKLCGNL